jgi:hypothetical protein
MRLQREREPRRRCFSLVELSHREGVIDGMMLDLSDGGARVGSLDAYLDEGPRTGEVVRVRTWSMDGEETEVAAIVAWTREPRAIGLRFLDRLDGARIGQLAS